MGIGVIIVDVVDQPAAGFENKGERAEDSIQITGMNGVRDADQLEFCVDPAQPFQQNANVFHADAAAELLGKESETDARIIPKNLAALFS